MQKSMAESDVIFSIGNGFSMGTYEKFGKPLFRINPSTSPSIQADLSDLAMKDKKKYLYFGGNGNITKGLDLLIEAFQKTPDLELYICAPHEKDFDEAYKDVLPHMRNVHWIGFIPVGGDTFNALTAECAFVILPSSSEGIATSVVNCMRKGLIPAVTFEAGIDTGDFGFMIPDIHIDALAQQLRSMSSISDEELRERIYTSYLASFEYTQDAFSKMFETALVKVLRDTIHA